MDDVRASGGADGRGCPATSRWLRAVAVAGVWASVGAATGVAQTTDSIVGGVYTLDQAGRGEAVFDRTCATCHGPREFSGGRFRLAWVGRTAGELFETIATLMPEDRPGSLRPDEYAAVVAYLFQLNDYPAGADPLPPDRAALDRLAIEASPRPSPVVAPDPPPAAPGAAAPGAPAASAAAAAPPPATPAPGAPSPSPSPSHDQWRYIGGDAGHTRYSGLDQIDAGNFEDLEVAWLWRGDNYGPSPLGVSRATPIHVDGVLYTVAGSRRTVVAIDPATGETLWTYREPHTTRYDRGMRNGYGKGVAYAEIDGRGVIYMLSPAFFLHALDATTGRPLEGWGRPVPLPGFPATGVVDLVPDLIRDWGPWQSWDGVYDPDFGLPRELGHITSSSPPIVVNGVVVVGNSAEQGYNQTRIENVPGDIMGYDARTGAHAWTFHVIPRPGELGHDTWENDAWAWTGDVSSWAPLSADPARGLVYVPTNPPTIDFYGGFRPGDNLFGTSVIALDVATGRRVWHFQTVHHDIWNFDNPTAPVVLDVTVDGRPRPIVVQTTKQGWAYTFDRVTGEPVWPIEERPVPASEVPGEQLSPTQPMPTRPAAYEMQGLTRDDLIDFTPALRAEAEEIVTHYRLGPIFNPPIHRGHPSGLRSFVSCPSGASNIFGPTSADPETGILYVSTRRGCRSENIVPGADIDQPDDIMTTGTTIADFAVLNRGDFRGPQDLPIFKPPYSRIVAIDMNTGEHLWETPNGDTPERIRRHPALAGVTLPNTGQLAHPVTMVTGTLLIAAEGVGGTPRLHALDKRTGERVGTVELPASGQYGMMGYAHDGRQYIVVQVAGPTLPGSLVALRLPE